MLLSCLSPNIKCKMKKPLDIFKTSRSDFYLGILQNCLTTLLKQRLTLVHVTVPDPEVCTAVVPPFIDVDVFFHFFFYLYIFSVKDFLYLFIWVLAMCISIYSMGHGNPGSDTAFTITNIYYMRIKKLRANSRQRDNEHHHCTLHNSPAIIMIMTRITAINMAHICKHKQRTNINKQNSLLKRTGRIPAAEISLKEKSNFEKVSFQFQLRANNEKK